MSRETCFVSVLGWSGSGKTTFVVSALEECRRRGLSAAAVKRARHDADVSLDGKDSTLFLDAGAVTSLYVGDSRVARFSVTPTVQDRAFYLRECGDLDYIFMEGAEVEGCIRVGLAGSADRPEGLKRPAQECDLVLSSDAGLVKALAGTACLDPHAIPEIIDFLEAHRAYRGTSAL